MSTMTDAYTLAWITFCQVQRNLTTEIFDELVYNHEKNQLPNMNTLEYQRYVADTVTKVVQQYQVPQDYLHVFYFTWLLLSFYGYLVLSQQYKLDNVFQILCKFHTYYGNFNEFEKTFSILKNIPNLRKWYDSQTIQRMWSYMQPIYNGTGSIFDKIQRLRKMEMNLMNPIEKQLYFVFQSLYLFMEFYNYEGTVASAMNEIEQIFQSFITRFQKSIYPVFNYIFYLQCNRNNPQQVKQLLVSIC